MSEPGRGTIVRATLNPEQARLLVAASKPVGSVCGIEIRTNDYIPPGWVCYLHADGSISVESLGES